MGRMLWLDCSSGVSGDMTVAALLDAGANRATLDAALASLLLQGFEVRVGRVHKNGLDACDFAVLLDEAHENHDHDMAWLHGHGHEHRAAETSGAVNLREAQVGPCSNSPRPAFGAAAELRAAPTCASPGNDGGGGRCAAPRGEGGTYLQDALGADSGVDLKHRHEHRRLADVLAVLHAASMTPGARAIAERVFTILADAEAAAHGTTRELVHFHEVGAVDSIVDVVAAAACLDSLGVDDVVVTELAEGCGTVRCAHGVMPVPVPAVAAVASAYGLPLHATGVRGELVTPTGAAIVAAIRTRGELPARYRIERVGLGAGKRSYEGCSGVVRALVIEEAARGQAGGCRQGVSDATPHASTVVKLECDIDDCTGEALGHVLQALLDAGAREAHVLPLTTKKNRPAWQLQVLCDEAEREHLEELVFEQTTTIGIRRTTMERTVLPRRFDTVETALGPVAVKTVTLPNGRKRSYPEHDSVTQAAQKAGVPYQEAWQAATAACARVHHA